MRAGDVSKTLPALGPNSSTLSGSAESLVARSVGGGHKKRALAHGYSIRTPSGFVGGEEGTLLDQEESEGKRLGPDAGTLTRRGEAFSI
jgi:hypothetical protein